MVVSGAMRPRSLVGFVFALILLCAIAALAQPKKGAGAAAKEADDKAAAVKSGEKAAAKNGEKAADKVEAAPAPEATGSDDLGEPPPKAPAGEIAAHRRTEEHDAARPYVSVLLQGLEYDEAAQAVADEVRRSNLAREARQALGVRLQRPRAPVVGEQVAAQAGATQPRGERRHYRRGHPQTVQQDDVAHCAQAGTRPGRAKMPLMRTMRLSVTHR